MNRDLLLNIKQAKVPIKEFEYANIKCDALINDMDSNWFVGLADLHDAVDVFIEDNKDNQDVINPYDEATYTFDRLAIAYNANVGLSHFDDIMSRHDVKLHEIAKVSSKSSLMDALGSIYFAEDKDMNTDQIYFMLDNSLDFTGHFNPYKAYDIRQMFDYGLDINEVKIITNNVTDGSRVVVMDYLKDAYNKMEETAYSKHAFNCFIDMDEISFIGSCKNRVAAQGIKEILSDPSYKKEEITDIVSAVNVYSDYMTEQKIYSQSQTMHQMMDCIKTIHKGDSVFGNNKLTDVMESYIDMKDKCVSYNIKNSPSFDSFYMNTNMEASKSKFDCIIVPSSFVSEPHDSKYGKCDVVSVPVDGHKAFGKMIVADILVDKNSESSIIYLQADRDRTVSFYDKNTKAVTTETFSISELKDIYDKHWEKLNFRNKVHMSNYDNISKDNDKSFEL